MARLTSELLVRLVDGITKPAQAAARALRGIGQAQDEANNRRPLGQRLADASNRAQERVDALRGRMVDAAAAGFALQRALAAPMRAAMQFEDAMADVRKVVDFPTPDGLKNMQADLLEMSKRIPISVNGLAEITAAAGQAGLELSEILPFVEGAAKIGTAFDISASEAGDSLAKMRTGLGMTNEEVFLLADAMNHLSDNSAATARDILDVVRRVGAQSKQFGFTAIETSAFASAMLAAGAESEVAATSFRNMGLNLTRAESATSGQREAMAALGLEANQLAKDMQKDAVRTTVDVLRRISRLPEWQQASISNQLFGSEARALGPLLTNIELLERQLGLVAQESLYAGSAQREFEIRAKTTSNAIQLFQNRITQLGIVIGSALFPALNDLMQTLAPLVDGITKFAEAHPTLTSNVIAATSALIAFRVAAIGLQFATGFTAAGVLSAASSFVNFGGSVKRGMGAAVAPVGKFGTHALGVFQTVGFRFRQMRTELAAGSLTLGAAMKGGFATGARAILQLLAPMALVRAAMVALKFAVIGTGIGAALVAIAAAGTWIYNNWQGIATMFEAFKGAFSRAIDPIRPALQPVIGAFERISNLFSTLTGQVDPLGGKWADLGIRMGTAVGEALVAVVQKAQEIFDAIAALPGRIASIHWGEVTAGLLAEFIAIPLRLVNLPAEIVGIFTGIDLGAAARSSIDTFIAAIKAGIMSLGSWVKSKLADMFTFSVPSLPSWLGGGGGTPAPAGPTLPQRAEGGPVKRGQSYWVGEEGIPEIFTPGADGFITPMDKMGDAPRSRPSAAGGRSGGAGNGVALTYSPTYHIGSVQGVADLQAQLEAHDRRAQAQFESMLDGAFADS